MPIWTVPKKKSGIRLIETKEVAKALYGAFEQKMHLEISWEDNSLSPAEQAEMEQLLKQGISEALLTEGSEYENAEVGLLLVDDKTIHQLNKDYRGVDRPTDVLSFALREQTEEEPEICWDSLDDSEQIKPYEDLVLGDIVISVERARSQAAEYGHSLGREMVYLAVHGALHLLGYDHCTDEDRALMREKEEQIMNKLGLSR